MSYETNYDLQNTTQKTRSNNTNPTKNREWTQVLRKDRQFLLHFYKTLHRKLKIEQHEPH